MAGYFGSKAIPGLYHNIIAMMPPHETYIETHLGGGAVMQRKPPTTRNIGLDLDPDSLAQFSCDYPVQLVNVCAHEFLANYAYSGKELIYCDPPYLEETRTGPFRYRFDYTRQLHIELLEILKSLPCPVILSGYPSPLYDDLLDGWRTLELQVMSRGGPRTEKLWYNYDIDRVHWITYAGKNFTDRQRIKRKAQRWHDNYKALPHPERLAVMAALMAAEAEAF